MARSALVAGLVVGLGLALGPRAAHAEGDESESSYDPGKALRRSEFAVGLLVGGTAGAVSGYPNELEKIDVPAYEARTGLGGGTGGGLWIGGALRDWFVFGLGVQQASIAGNGVRSSSTTFIFHVETYPLFARGGAWRDLGVLAEFGAGSRSITRGATTSVADGGLMSIATFGVLYEPLHLGTHVSAGPLVQVTYQGSQSLNATFATIGLRASFYGGPG